MCQTWILEPDYIIQCISYEFKFRRAEQLMIESKAQEVSNLWKCLLQSMCLHRRERGKLQIYKLQKGWKKSRHCRFWQRERWGWKGNESELAIFLCSAKHTYNSIFYNLCHLHQKLSTLRKKKETVRNKLALKFEVAQVAKSKHTLYYLPIIIPSINEVLPLNHLLCSSLLSASRGLMNIDKVEHKK